MLRHVDEFRPIHNLESMRSLTHALSAGNVKAIDPKLWLSRVA